MIKPIISADEIYQLVNSKSELISSLYEFTKTFEQIDLTILKEDIIALSLQFVQDRYKFNSGWFIEYDHNLNNFFIRGNKTGFTTYNQTFISIDSYAAFAFKSKYVTYKNFQKAFKSTISGKMIQCILYIPIYFQDNFFGLLYFESIEEINLNSDDISALKTIALQLSFAFNNSVIMEKIENNFLSTINALTSTIEIKDPYTRGHSNRVAKYAIDFAFMLGLSTAEIKIIEKAALLHDIGKIGVGSQILNKVKPLDEADRFEIKKHPIYAEKILLPLDFLNKERIIIRHHHEWWDGTGYPDGLSKDTIPFESRIITLVDSFDAMINNRPYRKAFSYEKVIKEIETGVQKQFDPDLSEQFISIIRDKLIESRG